MTDLSRRGALQYLVAGGLSVVLVGAAVLYPDLAGVEGVAGYLFVGVVVAYLFALASDRVRRSRYAPLLQASFFLAWGGYNLSRGRLGLLTLVLLGGGSGLLLWEGYKLSTDDRATA